MSAAESELLARYARNRDAEAFRSLVEKHSDMVFSVSRRIVGDAADAEDIAQDCFILLSRHAVNLRAPVAGWLHHVAVNVSLKFLRDKQVRRNHEAHTPIATREAREESWESVRSAVDEAIAVLPERLRTPIILHYLEARRQEDIAAELKISQSAVSKRLTRGVALLRKHLRRAGFVTPAALAVLLATKAAEASPPSLVSSLGKLALSGVATSTQATLVNIGAVGGVSVMKIGVVTALAATAILAGGVATQSIRAQAPAKPNLPAAAPPVATTAEIQSPKPAPPTFGEDEALIKDLLQLDKLAQAEKQAGRLRFDVINVHTWALTKDEKICRVAAIIEASAQALAAVNMYSEIDRTLRLGETSLLEGIAFFDLKGRKLSFDIEQTGNHKGYYSIHLIDPLDRGGSLRLAIVTDKEISGGVIWKEGALRHLIFGDGSSNSLLQYCKIVLPESAIFVDSWPRPISIETIGDCTAVTVRRYRTENADWRQTIVFLWPKKDGTSLASLPPEYRGLREPRDAELSEKYAREMAKILDGGDYRDQSTPLGAILALNCGVVKNDGPLCVDSVYNLHENADKAQNFLANLTARLAPMRTYNIDEMSFLSTPAWPEKPKEGYVHPVYMCYPGTFIRKDTYGVIYHDGKWYVAGTVGDPYRTDVLQFSPELSLEEIPWNNAGKEALDRYRKYAAMNLESPTLWMDLGLKLVGGEYWIEAMDAFSRSEALSGDDPSRVTTVVWQGHIYDVQGERDKALAKYKEALQMVMGDYSMRHDQWGIVINREWIENRMKDPFVPQMIGKEAK